LAHVLARVLPKSPAKFAAVAAGDEHHPPAVSAPLPAASHHQPLKSGISVIKVPICGNQSSCNEDLGRAIEWMRHHWQLAPT